MKEKNSKKVDKHNNTRNANQHMKRLQRGFGSIRYLGPGRRNAYAVHPPGKTNADGSHERPKALCYVSDSGGAEDRD